MDKIVRIAIIGGDGIGPEVVVDGIRVLRTATGEAVTGQYRGPS